MTAHATAAHAGLPPSPESHFAVASPVSGAVALCRQSNQAWLISRALADILQQSKGAGHRVFLHFCEAAAFVAWGYMQDLRDGCLLSVSWQQTATLQISLSHAQNLMLNPALSDKAGQILLRLFGQANDLQNVQPSGRANGTATDTLMQPDGDQEGPKAQMMSSSLNWNHPPRLLQGNDVAAMGEDGRDSLEEVQRETSVPVGDASDQVCITRPPHGHRTRPLNATFLKLTKKSTAAMHLVLQRFKPLSTHVVCSSFIPHADEGVSITAS